MVVCRRGECQTSAGCVHRGPNGEQCWFPNHGSIAPEWLNFPTAAIATLSSGVMLCKEFKEMHQAAEFLMGHPIWIHHFADKQLWLEMQRTIAEQCPGMPTELHGVTRDNYGEHVAKIETEFGKTVRIRKGSGLTAILPTDGIHK